MQANFGIAIHGGAKTMIRQNITAEKEDAYKKVLADALQAGYDILKRDGASLDAVEAAVKVMEDSPLLNAGKGSVFTSDENNEMDAAIMNGKNLTAGAVAAVRTIKNPIIAARAVMEKSSHIMLAGSGAEQFAKECGLEIVDPSYFFEQDQWNKLENAKMYEDVKRRSSKSVKPTGLDTEDEKFGTVGAVALDKYGNLAAANSTGGLTNKKFGRIGDTPIIGSGTYANNKTCAVACTGHGEYFIRAVSAYDVSAMMEYKGLSLKEASLAVIEKITAMGGAGGLIAIDKEGNITQPFNSDGMYRGFIKEDGNINVAIYKEL